jgi:hypothetical protein
MEIYYYSMTYTGYDKSKQSREGYLIAEDESEAKRKLYLEYQMPIDELYIDKRNVVETYKNS